MKVGRAKLRYRRVTQRLKRSRYGFDYMARASQFFGKLSEKLRQDNKQPAAEPTQDISAQVQRLKIGESISGQASKIEGNECLDQGVAGNTAAHQPDQLSSQDNATQVHCANDVNPSKTHAKETIEDNQTEQCEAINKSKEELIEDVDESAEEDESTDEDDYESVEEGEDKKGGRLDDFREVLDAIDLDKLKDFALSLRKKQIPDTSQLVDCEICTVPKSGSYNLVYFITFSDGERWCARIPGYGKKPTRYLREKMDIEYRTMKYIARQTTFPLPSVHYWTTNTIEIGVAFALISFVEGQPLSALWYADEVFGEEKRLTVLSSIAEEMKKLYVLQFPSTGMLCCMSDDEEQPEVSNALDYFDDGSCLWSGVIKQGQIHSFHEWLRKSAKRLEEDDPDNREQRSLHGALRALTNSVPTHMQYVPMTLSLADLDLQNVFVDAGTGKVTGFIDFDDIAVQPAHIGAAAYPLWLVRNFNPLEYRYEPGVSYVDSPQDLARYRKHYADSWKEFDVSHLGLKCDIRWIQQSHIMKTIWSAIVESHGWEGMTIMLIDHAYANAFELQEEELAQLWDNEWNDYEPEKLKLAIMKGLWS